MKDNNYTLLHNKKIINNFAKRFAKHKDFSTSEEKRMLIGENFKMFDLVIYFGNKEIAVVEIKETSLIKKQTKMDLNRELISISQNSNIPYYFAVVHDVFYYYNRLKQEICEKDEKDVYEELIDSVEDHSEKCDKIIDKFLKRIKEKQWEKYGEVLSRYIKKGTLRQYGENIFLDQQHEKEFMQEFLWMDNKYDKSRFCRYTSDKSFFLSVKGKFRLMDIEAMNDELEAKVINNYSTLKVVSSFLADYVYNGYIMCFSAMSRHDKLFNWYMYGDKAKGVCFTVEPKGYVGDDFFFAPVVYIPHDKQKADKDHLDFLNELMNMKVDGNKKFILRYWHFWKYFFKYDYYKDEEEVRLLIIQKGRGEAEWSEEYHVPYHYIEREIDRLPFTLKRITFGPKSQKHNNLDSYLVEKFKDVPVIADSEILGYR